MFVGSTKKEDYDLDKVYGAEKWIFLIDAACSFGVGMNRLPRQVGDGSAGPDLQPPWWPMYMFSKVKNSVRKVDSKRGLLPLKFGAAAFCNIQDADFFAC